VLVDESSGDREWVTGTFSSNLEEGASGTERVPVLAATYLRARQLLGFESVA
jgi:hypothetical protein